MSGFFESQDPEQGKRHVDDTDWEIDFFAGIVEQAPDYVEALISLGNLYTKRGDYAKGLEIDRRLVRLRPDDPIIHYNLACSLSLLHDLDAAFTSLENALDLGYKDFDYLLTDEDLQDLRHDPRFRLLIRKARRQA